MDRPAERRKFLTVWRLLGLALFVIVLVAVIWWLTPYPRGMFMAWVDQMRGHDEVQTFGPPVGAGRHYSRLLDQKYGVTVRPVAWWWVEAPLVSYVRGYNRVAMARINSRHGKDVFAECEAAALEHWQLHHGEDGP